MNKMNFALFMAGITVGVAGTWLYMKKHYEHIAQEEIDSVKAAFAKRKPDYINTTAKETVDNNKSKADMAKLKPDLVNYAAKLQEEGYTNYTEHSNKNINKEKSEPMSDRPYVISPDEYGVSDDYTQISLTYYSDGVLADDEDEIVEDIENIVGEDFADHFGDYEDDAVYIRNDQMKCDYEILRDNRSFETVTGMGPEQED